MIERFHDWPERLDTFIRERETMRFAFGKTKNDCCSFAFQCAKALTGYDALADIEDYADAADADLVLDAHPMEAFASLHFPERSSIGFAQRGDIALVVVKAELALTVVEGASLVGPGAFKLERLPRVAMLKAWAV